MLAFTSLATAYVEGVVGCEVGHVSAQANKCRRLRGIVCAPEREDHHYGLRPRTAEAKPGCLHKNILA